MNLPVIFFIRCVCGRAMKIDMGNYLFQRTICPRCGVIFEVKYIRPIAH